MMEKIILVVLLVVRVQTTPVVPDTGLNATEVTVENVAENENASVTDNFTEKIIIADELSKPEMIPKPLPSVTISSQSAESCPSLLNADVLTESQLFKRLIHPCRFDRIQRPQPKPNQPVDVFARAYIYFLMNLEASNLQFKFHAMLQLRYNDPRLKFRHLVSNPTSIIGDSDLRKDLWIPHLFFANEKDSGVLGTTDKDILTSITPDGEITIAKRISATLLCQMDFRKFPFDEQKCKTVLESWMYNVTEVQLHWEEKSPVAMGPNQHITEYVLSDIYTNETNVNANLVNFRHGDFAGNYSSLTFTIILNRQAGYYVIDYFIPSAMIVASSWITFWLQADQTAPRAMLGCSTMLTFITLATSQDKNLPKVGYIKASEIWFMGCMGFIFFSLVEFAFVNTIWRRRRHLKLKKVNASNILKQTLPTPGKMSKALNVTLDVPTPPPTTVKIDEKDDGLRMMIDHKQKRNSGSSLAKGNHSLRSISEGEDPSKGEISTAIKNNSNSSRNNSADHSDTRRRRSIIAAHMPHFPKSLHTTMTPQQISIWIDKRSRVVFPICFLCFNIFYWSFIALL